MKIPTEVAFRYAGTQMVNMTSSVYDDDDMIDDCYLLLSTNHELSYHVQNTANYFG